MMVFGISIFSMASLIDLNLILSNADSISRNIPRAYCSLDIASSILLVSL